MRGKKPLRRAQGKSGITASAEFQESAAMFAWKIRPGVWSFLPRSERLYMMAIAEGVSRIDHAALED
jgi:hypothetical protein